MKTPEPEMKMFCILENPSDVPQKFVVREWRITLQDDDPVPGPAQSFDTLEQARASVPPGFVRTERSAYDAPHIVETWI